MPSPAIAPPPRRAPSAAFGRVFNLRTLAATFYLAAGVALSDALLRWSAMTTWPDWCLDLAVRTRQSMISGTAILLAIATAVALTERFGVGPRRAAQLQGLAVLPGAVLGALLRHVVGMPEGQAIPWGWFGYVVGLWTLLGWFGQALLRLAWEDQVARQQLQAARRDHESWNARQLEARLTALQAQIEPHFLFNTLATVRRLCATAPDQGRDMLASLTAYLRAALPSLRQRLGRLDAELALVRHYLTILQMRMGPRLATHLAVPESLGDALIPPMALLTLVENAVKHGLAPLPQGGRIEIAARVDPGDMLVLTVCDNGQGFQGQGGPGVGLANTRARLAALFGARATLSLEASQPAGVTACLRLPLRRAGQAPSPVDTLEAVA